VRGWWAELQLRIEGGSGLNFNFNCALREARGGGG
jgi:hypothetical protein